jgi:hypothetical protein
MPSFSAWCLAAARETADQNDGQRDTTLAHLSYQCHSVHAPRHHDVRQHQSDIRCCRQFVESRLCSRNRYHLIAQLVQHRARQGCDLHIVFETREWE